MRFIIVTTGFLICVSNSFAQSPEGINESAVSRIEKILAADDMQGRKVFTPGIDKAASFISNEFKEAGLKPLPGAPDFNQTFTMADPLSTEISATLDGNTLDKKKHSGIFGRFLPDGN